VVGGDGLRLGTRGARLMVARMSAGETATLPDEARQHVFAASGSVSLAGHVLGSGDAARVTDEPGHVVRAIEPAELLVWSFASDD
jgi:redox-sensitive bicupin YhaK (pirin superfamily)